VIIKKLTEIEEDNLALIWGIKKNYEGKELTLKELESLIDKKMIMKLEKKGFLKTILVEFTDVSLSKKVGLRSCVFLTEEGTSLCTEKFNGLSIF
jgi:hypothetical protein